MIYETKFSLEETVFHLYEGKIRESVIDYIEVRDQMWSQREVKISYFVNVGTKQDYKCLILNEKECFSTRESLIESL